MWYVIQTTTGKEQELVDLIHKMLPKTVYNECFFMKRQLLKRLGGKWLEVTETLFPAYVFLDLDAGNSEAVFYQLKKVPEFTKLLGDGQGNFIPLEKEEVEFLELLCQCRREGDERQNNSSEKYLVPLTRVILDLSGDIKNLEGPLEYFKEKIVRLNLRKRCVIIELTIRGELQTAMLGVKLEKD